MISQTVETIARSAGRENSVESCHVSGCHGSFGLEAFSTIKRSACSPYKGGSVLLTEPSVPRTGGSVALTSEKNERVVIFFSLTEAPLPDPTPTPPNGPETDPKRTRNGAKRTRNGPKRSQTEPKWTEIKLFGVGRAGGLSGWGGGGGCKGKRKSLRKGNN